MLMERRPVAHRHPEHSPDGDPCSCGIAAGRHRKRDRTGRARKPRPSLNENAIVGIDGEGSGRFPHLYTYLAAVDEHNHTIGEVYNAKGLTTVECFEFLLELGIPRVFGYSIGYDLTKILADLPPVHRYVLARPELRRAPGKRAPWSVLWKGYKLGYVQGRFTLRRVLWDGKRSIATGPTVTVWDVFKFYQSKFTKALTDWKIATADKLARMVRMKDKRSEFDQLSQKGIQEYCREECLYLARLVRELIEVHDSCGLPLRAFYGAGSTASALLRKYSIKKYIALPPKAMREAVNAAFFGGRFECSHVGPIRRKVYNADISSAYPYHITFLPCLTHGRWTYAPRYRGLNQSIERARLALVHAKVHPSRSGPDAFGPFPWRAQDGTIVFPLTCDGVWVWRDEYLEARKLWPAVDCTEAWLYHTDCDCQPFKALPDMYRERCRLGKEDGRGQPYKLGPNAIYGKLAQSKGDPPYQSWVWAGNITSSTRAQLLVALGMANDPWAILMFATDGVFSTEKLHLPKPRDTGTGDLAKPLGGWEVKDLERGMFLLRPGVYFPLDPTEDEAKDIRARGMAKDVLLRNAAAIQAHWEEHGVTRDFRVTGLQRFVGMTSGVLRGTERTGGPRVLRDKEGRSLYGEWVDYPVDVSFDPLPKRAGMASGQRLAPHAYMPGESTPYRKAARSADAAALQALEAIMLEQPNGDFCE